MGQQGLLQSGNIDLHNRPVVKHPDGSVSTVYSVSFGTDNGEVLVPMVSDDGRMLSEDEALEQYRQTGRHLGLFTDLPAATAYAKQLHHDQEREYSGRPPTAHSTGQAMNDQQTPQAADEDAALLAQIRAAKAQGRKPTFSIVPDAPKPDERSFGSKFVGSALSSAGNSIAGIPQMIADVYHMNSGDMGARLGVAQRFAEGAQGMWQTGKDALGGDPEALGSVAGQVALGALTKRFAPGVGRSVGRVARGPLNRMMPMQTPPVPRVFTPEVMPMSSPVEIAAKLAADDAIRQPIQRRLPAGPPAMKQLGPAQSIQLPESTLTSFERQAGSMPGTAGPAGSSPLTGPRISRLMDEPPTGTQLPNAGLDQMSGYSLGRYAEPFDAEGGFYARPGTMSPGRFNPNDALAEAIMPTKKSKAKK